MSDYETNLNEIQQTGSGTGGTSGSGHNTASATKSYHNGGVEGDSFAKWYDANLSGIASEMQNSDGLSSSGKSGPSSGSGGTKGSGSGGTSGSGSGGTNGSGFGGTKGSGSSGTNGSGSGGTKGSGSGGTSGSGSGGTKGSGSGGTNGSGSGGIKGSGSSGTNGSGSGGTKGSGSGGTNGSGSGGTKGSGSGGTSGSSNPDDGKTTKSVEFGDDQQVTVSVTETPQGQLFISVQSTSFDNGEADIDGLFFNMSDNAALNGLKFFPDPLALPVTGFDASADSITSLPNGTSVPGAFDAVVQFGQSAGSTDGSVVSAGFTLWSDSGPLTLEDIDLTNMSLVITASDGSTKFLNDGRSLNDTDDNEGQYGSGSGSGGTKGSGSGGTNGSGSGGTKGSGSGGTNGSGSGGTKGSGSGGTKSSGSGGTKGSGSGGTKGSGSGGTKGSGSGGTKGSGSGGTKGSGSGGTNGSGSGGTKGSGSGGTTGGYSQWSGANTLAAADTLPAFTAYPEDGEEQQDPSVNDVMSLMTQDVSDENQDISWGSATAGGTGVDIF